MDGSIPPVYTAPWYRAVEARLASVQHQTPTPCRHQLDQLYGMWCGGQVVAWVACALAALSHIALGVGLVLWWVYQARPRLWEAYLDDVAKVLHRHGACGGLLPPPNDGEDG